MWRQQAIIAQHSLDGKKQTAAAPSFFEQLVQAVSQQPAEACNCSVVRELAAACCRAKVEGFAREQVIECQAGIALAASQQAGRAPGAADSWADDPSPRMILRAA